MHKETTNTRKNAKEERTINIKEGKQRNIHQDPSEQRKTSLKDKQKDKQTERHAERTPENNNIDTFKQRKT